MARATGKSGRPPLGASAGRGGVHFAVRSATAQSIVLCLYDEDGEQEVARQTLEKGNGDVFSGFVAGLRPGARYGLRADGEYDPARGLWFDPDKLLVDPYAVELDRPFVHDGRLAAQRGQGVDTAGLVPKAIVPEPAKRVKPTPAIWRPGGLVYELPVRAFTMLHPDIAAEMRGTIAALAEPAVIDHLKRLGVDAVELMPVVAWIDERHLPELGLRNAWGYNPVSFMALDPRLAPGGVAELRDTVAALHTAGIGVVLDLVFNHTGESDALGPTLSLRGLDNPTYYRHGPDGVLVNDTGTGNTIACDREPVRRLMLDTLRHFVSEAGVDGFRFDLATILGRTDDGFDPAAPLLAEIAADDLLADRVMIAEPWDIGPGGYQLGRFPDRFLEWNDRYRDDVRRFWRGDAGRLGTLATRLAGSSDVFSGPVARSVNFLAAHDGMTLADLVAYERKHNEANGEDNRDGHDENLSWNNGAEGASDDPAVLRARRNDVRALLATLFASRGTIMLTAGDEFGRTQQGNNNAYAQDNAITWLDWEGRDHETEAFVAALARLRHGSGLLRGQDWLADPQDGDAATHVAWLRTDGAPMSVADWENPDNRRLAMVLSNDSGAGLAVLVNGSDTDTIFVLPGGGDGWDLEVASAATLPLDGARIEIAARSVALLVAQAPASDKIQG